MKIVIPTNSKIGLNDLVAEHFGRCNTYTFLDENKNILEVINNTSKHMNGADLPPKLMKTYGTNILLCKDLGPKALNLCRELGIEVYVSQAKTVKEIFDLWKNKKLKRAGLNDVCEEHKK
jgi:predicted Fe-Mo cluster-binding NifX family protein